MVSKWKNWYKLNTFRSYFTDDSLISDNQSRGFQCQATYNQKLQFIKTWGYSDNLYFGYNCDLILKSIFKK